MDQEQRINSLIDQLTFVRSKTLRKILLGSNVKKFGPIPEEYREAIDAVVEVYALKE